MNYQRNKSVSQYAKARVEQIRKKFGYPNLINKQNSAVTTLQSIKDSRQDTNQNWPIEKTQLQPLQQRPNIELTEYQNRIRSIDAINRKIEQILQSEKANKNTSIQDKGKKGCEQKRIKQRRTGSYFGVDQQNRQNQYRIIEQKLQRVNTKIEEEPRKRNPSWSNEIEKFQLKAITKLEHSRLNLQQSKQTVSIELQSNYGTSECDPIKNFNFKIEKAEKKAQRQNQNQKEMKTFRQGYKFREGSDKYSEEAAKMKERAREIGEQKQFRRDYEHQKYLQRKKQIKIYQNAYLEQRENNSLNQQFSKREQKTNKSFDSIQISTKDFNQPNPKEDLLAEKNSMIYKPSQMISQEKGSNIKQKIPSVAEHQTQKSGQKNSQSSIYKNLYQEVQISKKETIKLAEALSQQIHQDQKFRYSKWIFSQWSNPSKWAILQSKITPFMSISQLQATFTLSSDQHNPFFQIQEEVSEACIQKLIRGYEEANKNWNHNIKQCVLIENLEKEYFNVRDIDLGKKGYLSIEDLVCFVNLYTGKFFRNRDAIGLFKKLTNNKASPESKTYDKLQYEVFLQTVTK